MNTASSSINNPMSYELIKSMFEGLRTDIQKLDTKMDKQSYQLTEVRENVAQIKSTGDNNRKRIDEIGEELKENNTRVSNLEQQGAVSKFKWSLVGVLSALGLSGVGHLFYVALMKLLPF